jgi:hypothetical protein
MKSNLEMEAGSSSVDRHVRQWDRHQWAVEMRSKSCRPEGMLLGVAWHKIIPPAHDGEPSRPLLFETRSQARKWCAAKTAECARHSPDWRFRPVRVREIILLTVADERQLPEETK